MGEILFHVFILGGFGVFLAETMNINTARITDVIGPVGFPRAVIILGMILTAVSLYQSTKKYLAKKKKSNGSKVPVAELNIKFVGVLIGVVFFILISEYIGFFLSAFILMTTIMILLGADDKKKVIGITIVAALIFTVVFGRVLHVPLPRGISLAKELSFFLY